MLIHAIKIILVLISLTLANENYKRDNKSLTTYWLIVSLYWAVNFIQGLI